MDRIVNEKIWQCQSKYIQKVFQSQTIFQILGIWHYLLIIKKSKKWHTHKQFLGFNVWHIFHSKWVIENKQKILLVFLKHYYRKISNDSTKMFVNKNKVLKICVMQKSNRSVLSTMFMLVLSFSFVSTKN